MLIHAFTRQLRNQTRGCLQKQERLDKASRKQSRQGMTFWDVGIRTCKNDVFVDRHVSQIIQSSVSAEAELVVLLPGRHARCIVVPVTFTNTAILVKHFVY